MTANAEVQPMNHQKSMTVGTFCVEHQLTRAAFNYAYGLAGIEAFRAGTTRLLTPDEQRLVLEERTRIERQRDARRHRAVEVTSVG